MGLTPTSLPDFKRRGGSAIYTLPSNRIVMTTDEAPGGGAQTPGKPQDLVNVESDVPRPFTVYATAENQDLPPKPIVSTEVEIEWRLGRVTFTERWNPCDLVRNLVCNSLRVSAKFYLQPFDSPVSYEDIVTAWAVEGHAASPRAFKLWEFSTQIGDPLNGVESFIIPPFADSFMMMSGSVGWFNNSFFSAPGGLIQFCQGDGTSAESLNHSMYLEDPDLINSFYEPQPLMPGCRSMVWQSGGAAWVGDDDWMAIMFMCTQ